MKFQTLKDLNLKNKTVLMRADLNVPKQHNLITDTTRIDRLKPTIQYLRDAGAKILILSHFGRPEGERNPEMSLAFLTQTLEECWNAPVSFCPDCIGEIAEQAAANAKPGSVIILENVRFHKGEKANDPDFAKKLAKLADIYVNDAFSASHRAHASTQAITEHLPAAAGFLMEQELNALSNALNTPKKPVLAVAGGSKISTKLGVLKNLAQKVDYLVLGGGMANTFLYAQGYDLGRSLCEKDMADTAKKIMQEAEKAGCEIIVPKDVVVAKELKKAAEHKTVSVNKIPVDFMAIDIGAQTATYIEEKIEQCRTIVWNGPMGVFEIPPFDNGTNRIAQAVARHTKNSACISVAGGGDTISALENAGCIDDFSYISTAGGAFLEWMEGKELPGVDALTRSMEEPLKWPA